MALKRIKLQSEKLTKLLRLLRGKHFHAISIARVCSTHRCPLRRKFRFVAPFPVIRRYLKINLCYTERRFLAFPTAYLCYCTILVRETGSEFTLVG